MQNFPTVLIKQDYKCRKMGQESSHLPPEDILIGESLLTQNGEVPPVNIAPPQSGWLHLLISLTSDNRRIF